MISRRSVSKGIFLASVVLAPWGARAQLLGTGLTVEIAKGALVSGTTREAAEAWLRYWNLDYRFTSSIRFYSIWGGLPMPAGTLGVLEGASYVSWNGGSGSFIEVYIYLDAADRVLETRAYNVEVSR